MAHSAGFPLFMVTEADRTRSCMWAISQRFSVFLSSSFLRIQVKIRTKFELKNSDEFVRIRGYFSSENGHLAFLFYSPLKKKKRRQRARSRERMPALRGIEGGESKPAIGERRPARSGGPRKGEPRPAPTADLDHGSSAFAARSSRNLGRNLAQLVGCCPSSRL